MAQSSAFVPAWKRLGLKLQNAGQSQDADASASQNHQNQRLQDASALGEVSTGNFKSEQTATGVSDNTKLGKRKHHSSSADDEGASSQKSKKSKHGQENGFAVESAVSAPDVNEEFRNVESIEVPVDESKSTKGDSNYRKKKGGDPSYRKKKEPNSDFNAHKATKARKDDQAQSLSVPKARTPSLSPGHPTLVASTETDFPTSSLLTPKKRKSGASKNTANASLSPPKTDRRKSVSFTPDTKTKDGNSASNLFKKWVAEQKEQGADFTQAEVSQFAEPPKVHVANDIPSAATVNKETVAPTKGKKKDPSRYLNYLAQYHQDRTNWKFNKAIQNDVLENSLNVFRIPEQHSEALLEYVRGLQGAGVIQRLRERCIKAIGELDEEEKKAEKMDDPVARKAAKEEALQERLSKERKRRRVEADIENFTDHPHNEAYVRRLKRGRAQALLSALDMAAPAPTPQRGRAAATQTSDVAQATAPNVRKRKSRTDVSSDESSDSSSSDESSSDESSSSDEESGSDSDSDCDSDEESSGSNDSSSQEGNPAPSKGHDHGSSSSESDSDSNSSEESDDSSDSE